MNKLVMTAALVASAGFASVAGAATFNPTFSLVEVNTSTAQSSSDY